MLGGLLCHVEGWGLMLLWRDCLCPRDVAAVGSNQLCGMGVMRQNDGIWQLLIQRNRVQWTRFLCIENESKGLGFLYKEIESYGLDFYAQKPSPMDSVSIHRNEVQRTQFLCLENESNGLVFYAQKPSPLDSISLQRKPSPLDSFSAYVFCQRATQQLQKSSPIYSNC